MYRMAASFTAEMGRPPDGNAPESRSIALVGASDKSAWSLMIHVGLAEGGFEGRVYYINPRSPAVHGQPTVASLTEIKEPVDLCYIMVGTEGVLPVIALPALPHGREILFGDLVFSGNDQQDVTY